MDPAPTFPAACSLPDLAPLRFPHSLVEWRGKLPATFAGYLDRLRRLDLFDLYGVVCRFDEVREIVDIARCVHQVLDGGPRAAATGRWSFEELRDTRFEIHERIRKLHRRVNAAAMNARIYRPVVSDLGGTCHAVA